METMLLYISRAGGNPRLVATDWYVWGVDAEVPVCTGTMFYISCFALTTIRELFSCIDFVTEIVNIYRNDDGSGLEVSLVPT